MKVLVVCESGVELWGLVDDNDARRVLAAEVARTVPRFPDPPENSIGPPPRKSRWEGSPWDRWDFALFFGIGLVVGALLAYAL